ncbi:MAG: hypothetical protein IJ766_01310 [Clostridia bacterium]|nr:hypothetical protein [Clostridia bacterium]
MEYHIKASLRPAPLRASVYRSTLGAGIPYDGAYAVIPAREAQQLPTKNKTMQENLTVAGVPFFEVSNPSGETVIIGR